MARISLAESFARSARCKPLAAAVFIALSCPPALAWEVQTDQDAMDDTPVAVLGSAATAQDIGIAIKCWKGKPDETVLMLVTSVTYDATMPYNDAVPFRVRIDKNSPIEFVGEPSAVREKVGLKTDMATSPQVRDLLVQMADAKSAVAAQAGTVIAMFPLTNVAAQTRKFMDYCSLQ